MNSILLLEKLPQTVIIGGVGIEINSDFRTSIQFEELLNSYDLTDEEQQAEFHNEAIKLYYNVEIPQQLIIEAMDRVIWFYRCGKEFQETTSEESKINEKIYDFEYDDGKILAAFKEQYNINLLKEDLHWWEFKSMFDSLGDNTEIKKSMGIRAININEVSKEQKEHYRKLKKAYAIPKPVEEVQEDMEMAELLMNGGEITN